MGMAIACAGRENIKVLSALRLWLCLMFLFVNASQMIESRACFLLVLGWTFHLQSRLQSLIL